MRGPSLSLAEFRLCDRSCLGSASCQETKGSQLTHAVFHACGGPPNLFPRSASLIGLRHGRFAKLPFGAHQARTDWTNRAEARRRPLPRGLEHGSMQRSSPPAMPWRSQLWARSQCAAGLLSQQTATAEGGMDPWTHGSLIRVDSAGLDRMRRVFRPFRPLLVLRVIVYRRCVPPTGAAGRRRPHPMSAACVGQRSWLSIWLRARCCSFPLALLCHGRVRLLEARHVDAGIGQQRRRGCTLRDAPTTEDGLTPTRALKRDVAGPGSDCGITTETVDRGLQSSDAAALRSAPSRASVTNPLAPTRHAAQVTSSEWIRLWIPP